MSPDVVGSILATVAVLSVISGMAAWIYRRGRTEGNLEKSMQDNTHAVTELTASVGTLNDKLLVGFGTVHDRIDGHDVRLALAERDIEHLKAR